MKQLLISRDYSGEPKSYIGCETLQVFMLGRGENELQPVSSEQDCDREPLS